MSKYVDGFVVPVTKERLDDYRRLARAAGAVWREYGALEFVEAVADDVQAGEHTSFPQAVKLEADETVVFSYIVYESREHRDRVNEQVMKDPRIASLDMNAAPFDGKRMFWGGFQVIVDL